MSGVKARVTRGSAGSGNLVVHIEGVLDDRPLPMTVLTDCSKLNCKSLRVDSVAYSIEIPNTLRLYWDGLKPKYIMSLFGIGKLEATWLEFQKPDGDAGEGFTGNLALASPGSGKGQIVPFMIAFDCTKQGM